MPTIQCVPHLPFFVFKKFDVGSLLFFFLLLLSSFF